MTLARRCFASLSDITPPRTPLRGAAGHTTSRRLSSLGSPYTGYQSQERLRPAGPVERVKHLEVRAWDLTTCVAPIPAGVCRATSFQHRRYVSARPQRLCADALRERIQWLVLRLGHVTRSLSSCLRRTPLTRCAPFFGCITSCYVWGVWVDHGGVRVAAFFCFCDAVGLFTP